MDIKKRGNSFYSGDDPQNPQGKITFVPQENEVLNINHTFTDPAMRGQGIARRLVERLAQYAREEGYTLTATCPYAKKVLSEPQFADIFKGEPQA